MLKTSVSGLSTSKQEKLWNYKKRKSEVMISDFIFYRSGFAPSYLTVSRIYVRIEDDKK